MWLMESSLLRALETPRLMKRKVKCKREECCVGMIAGFQGSGFVDEKHVLILCNRGREEIRNLQFRSGCGDFCKSH